MKKKNISQKALAEHFQVSQNAVSAWFKNEVGLKAEQLPKLSKFLRVKISELYGEEATAIEPKEKLTSKEQGKVELLKEQLKEERDENKRLMLEVEKLKTKVPSKL